MMVKFMNARFLYFIILTYIFIQLHLRFRVIFKFQMQHLLCFLLNNHIQKVYYYKINRYQAYSKHSIYCDLMDRLNIRQICYKQCNHQKGHHWKRHKAKPYPVCYCIYLAPYKYLIDDIDQTKQDTF